MMQQGKFIGGIGWIDEISRLANFNKMDNFAYRVKYYYVIKEFITSINPCLYFKEDLTKFGIHKTKTPHMVLMDMTGEIPLVMFKREIGKSGAFGSAYLNYGMGYEELLKFSCKITITLEIETEVMLKLNDVVLRNEFPNFPLMYAHLLCKNACLDDYVPNSIKGASNYTIIISEIAKCDLETLFTAYDKPNIKQCESILVQVLFSIFKLHSLGYSHNDTHFGNMLIHDVTPGGYWHYSIGDVNVYVPNEGYLVVLWDFGICKRNVDQTELIDDYATPLHIICNKVNNPFTLEPINFVERFVKPLNTIIDSYMLKIKQFDEHKMINECITSILKNRPDFKSVDLTQVINLIPYKLY